MALKWTNSYGKHLNEVIQKRRLRENTDLQAINYILETHYDDTPSHDDYGEVEAIGSVKYRRLHVR